jgi:ParB/RepB/Spo0J family partition protein
MKKLKQITKLDKLPIEKISVVPKFNVREDFGTTETEDLEESISLSQGNIQPLIVSKNGDIYELVSGERRLKALKATNQSEALCVIYENLDEIEKTLLMFNENLGRKNLSWKEELKALKRLKDLGHEITYEFVKSIPSMSNKTWSLLESLKAVEEFPELIKCSTRKNCIATYRRKLREKENFNSLSDKEPKLKSIIKKNVDEQKIINSLVVDEFKEEIEYYKYKIENIYETIKELDKIERLTNGIWLKSEVKQMLEAAKACEMFGELDEKDKECIDCKNKSYDIYSKCEYCRDELGE